MSKMLEEEFVSSSQEINPEDSEELVDSQELDDTECTEVSCIVVLIILIK